MNLFSSREIASLVWLSIIIFFMFLNPKVKSAILKILKIAADKQIIISVVIILLYSTFWIILFSQFSFWSWKYLKEIAFWTMFNGIPICFGAVMNKDDNYYFSNIVKSNLKFIIIIEFLLSTYTFHIIIELILIPCTTFLFLLDTVASLKEEYSIVKRLTSFIIAMIGFIVIGFTIKNAMNNFTTVNSIDLMVTFTMPIVLSVVFIPLAYIYALYTKYQELFIIMQFKEPEDKRTRIMHRLEILKACKMSYKKVKKFRRSGVHKMYTQLSKQEFDEIIKDYK